MRDPTDALDEANDYGEPPYRRTVWYLHRQGGKLILEEAVLAADERTGEFSRLVRHSMTPISQIDYPRPEKFEAVGAGLEEGQRLELSPADEYWDDDELDEADDVQIDEAEVAGMAAELAAERVIPALAKAIRRAASELADYGTDPEIAAAYIFEAVARYIQQDAGVTYNELVELDRLDSASALQWFADNPPELDD